MSLIKFLTNFNVQNQRIFELSIKLKLSDISEQMNMLAVPLTMTGYRGLNSIVIASDLVKANRTADDRLLNPMNPFENVFCYFNEPYLRSWYWE